MRIGIDTGGTFTDFILIDHDTIRIHKVLSTPENPGKAVLQGLAELTALEITADITHGSTVATNALLERKGAKTALITTRGFEDILEIGRQTRKELYNLFVERPSPLVASPYRYGITERTLYSGDILYPVYMPELEEVLETIRREGIESLAICLLHSYANPANEETVFRAAKSLGIPLSVSYQILPEFREYERCSTTVVNAYVAPLMERYLSFLTDNLTHSSLRIMQSNGGSISAETAKTEAVRTILSGPAGGTVGALQVAKWAGYEQIITFDMGGTSTDVSLCPGHIKTTTESMIADCPIKLPVIDIHSVGAGGGSIAYLDPGGALRVGPQSAGADPGPVCYGKGTAVTVTDANLYLGRLRAEHFLGGNMPLFPERIKEAIENLAQYIGYSPTQTAEGIIEVANATMERAIRVISVEKGYDPREFTLVSFGGAGGLHACQLAQRLSIPTVLIPQHPGILSAYGMLLADLVKDYSHTVLLSESEASLETLATCFAPLEERGRQEMAREGVEPSAITVTRFLDVRYRGQSYELTVPYTPNFVLDFHRFHEQRYGYENREREVEVVTLRVQVVGRVEKPRLVKQELEQPASDHARIGEGEIVFSDVPYPSGIYDRRRLRPGNRVSGPALITEFSATTLVPPEFVCWVDAYENLILQRSKDN